MTFDVDVGAVPRDELPALLGRVVQLEAEIRLRLAEAPPCPAPSTSRIMDADEAAAVAGASRRWVLTATRGMRFRRDLTRKQPRFDEAGLREWLVTRRR